VSPPYVLKDTLITIKDVGLKFGDKTVLGGVSAEVKDIVRPDCITGQIVGILGPSGIGKTQLSRILAGLQEPTTGSVTVGPKAIPIAAGMIGYVPQNYPLLRHRTVLGNLVLAARRAGADAKAARESAFDYLKRFDLSDHWEAFPAELSGGQRQRIAIAQQLLCSEHYLVLDEPTTGLDPIMRDRVCEFIKQVASIAEENTIFLVSHDIPAVCSVADHLWLLGRKRGENGEPLGACIQFEYDLIERDIAWTQKPQATPGFPDLIRDIRSKFESL
jgi:polar amino acid transport system ATP-binding protein/sulfate transport system ATP-binding protein